MSLILDALKRAEGPDELGPPDGGVGSLASTEEEPSRSSGWLLILVAGCILGGGAVALINAGARSSVVEPPVSSIEGVEAGYADQPAPTDAGSVVAEPPSFESTHHVAGQKTSNSPGSDNALPHAQTNAASAARGKPQLEEPASAERIARLHEQMWIDAQSQADDDAAPALAPRVPAQIADGEAMLNERVEPTSLAPPIDLASAMETAARELGESVLVPHPALLLENLSQQQKDQIPTIVYSGHDYSSAGDSRVTLNNRQLRVGQRVATIQVIDILVDSVVLNVEGIEFRLRALNTWVNL